MPGTVQDTEDTPTKKKNKESSLTELTWFLGEKNRKKKPTTNKPRI